MFHIDSHWLFLCTQTTSSPKRSMPSLNLRAVGGHQFHKCFENRAGCRHALIETKDAKRLLSHRRHLETNRRQFANHYRGSQDKIIIGNRNNFNIKTILSFRR